METPAKNAAPAGRWNIPPSPCLKKLGFGSGVAVYELKRSPLASKFLSPWAIKKLIKRKNKDTKEIESRLKNEAEILRKLNHPNIVGFRAFMKAPEGNILAMEECTNCLGDLIESRHENELGPYPAKIIVKVVLDVAQALEYLHNEALLMHCDIKSYNILTKGDFTICKLCDFGVCLPVTDQGTIDKEKVGSDPEYTGTPTWCSPEVLNEPPDITTKADIYALGLVIWEMIALTIPLQEETVNSLCSLDESEISELDGMLEESIEQSERPNLPKDIQFGDEYDKIIQLYVSCTEQQKNDRPTAKELVSLLKNFLDVTAKDTAELSEQKVIF